MSAKSEKDRKCKRSACWHFYDKTPGGGFCRICQKEILTQAGGTTNLRNHLRRKHGELWTATMENRLDPTTLSIADHRTAHISSQNLEKECISLKLSPSARQILDNFESIPVSNAEGMVPASEEEPSDAVAETSSTIHAYQAFRDANGMTFLYLQPAPEGDQQNVQVLNGPFQPVVASPEALPTNGELVPVAVQKDPSPNESQGNVDVKAQEETTRKFVSLPVKNFQGSTLANRTAIRKLNRPSPVSTARIGNSNSNKEDSYDAFGKYIAAMLRNLPSKNACKLQGEIVNWILKEQIKTDH